MDLYTALACESAAPPIDLRYNLAVSEYYVGDMLRQGGRTEDARGLCMSALRRFEDLDRAAPGEIFIQSGLGKCAYLAGAIHDQLIHPAEALDSYRRAAEAFEWICSRKACPEATRRDLAASLHNLGSRLLEADRPDEAIANLRRALELREALIGEFPDHAGYQSDTAGTWQRLGEALERRGKPGGAASAYRQAIICQWAALARSPGVARYQEYLDRHQRSLDRVKAGDTVLSIPERDASR
jgi:tetratricopeptide (TPR) repeat protein